MMGRMRTSLVLSVVGTGLALAGCGGGPTSPAGSGLVAVHGELLGEGTAVTGSSTGTSGASAEPITVGVEGTPISTHISSSGVFDLEGLTPGTFTLVFSQSGTEIGRIEATAGPSDEVKLVVKIENSAVVLVDMELEHDGGDDGDEPDQADGADDDDSTSTCLIDGGRVGSGIELEGRVSSIDGQSFMMTTEEDRASGPVTVDASGASFRCNGDQGGTLCEAAVGDKVHVRGTLMECSLSSASVTATEVKIQTSGGGDDEDDDDDADQGGE